VIESLRTLDQVRTALYASKPVPLIGCAVFPALDRVIALVPHVDQSALLADQPDRW
jgi:hypothetical protein